jgi:hypothetical protein
MTTWQATHVSEPITLQGCTVRKKKIETQSITVGKEEEEHQIQNWFR